MKSTRVIRPLLAGALVLAAAAPAAAQPNPYGPYPYPYPNPGWGGWGSGFGPGATLSGSAQVIQANGQVMINQEQARQERQKYYQDKIQTKKMAFDEAMYEKANTPTFTEEQEKILGTKIQRIMSQPLKAEIMRGDTLNMLMPYIRALADQGALGPPVPISSTVLKGVNVSPGGAGPGVGMLKDGGKISWPLAVRGPTQQKIDKMLPQAIEQTVAGTLEPKTYFQLTAAVDALREETRKKFQTEQIDGGTWTSARHFIDSLSDSLKVLQDPDAAKFFNGGYAAHGNNVPELVANMTADGLKFGPATSTPSGEASYLALHNAFVSYARSAQMVAGLHTPATPPQVPPNYKSYK
jgi:hypothetical protein